MAQIKQFEDIQAWQKARELARLVYQLTNEAEWMRDFGLRDQVRRASVSAMANIAEGYGAGIDGEFTRFLRYAQRSSVEVQSHTYVALDQDYISQSRFEQLHSLANDVIHLIGGFIRYLNAPRS